MRKWVICGVLLLVAAPFLVRVWVHGWAHARVYAQGVGVPPHNIAVVFGAGVRNGYPSAMLYDRVASAADLYKNGTVQKLLMSGDNREANYNEPAAMRRAALEMGVPDHDIVLDLAGRSTYETCYRARDIFGVRQAVLVTQHFHLDRALLTCNTLGVDAVGYVADRRAYRSIRWNEFREVFATLNALVELYITQPQPVLGDKIPID